MPYNAYNQNFLETPDPVAGLQRRTGQNFLDVKQTMHERRTLEHDYDPSEGGNQPNHGTHSEGSAKTYWSAPNDLKYPTGYPEYRPTGEDKNGVEIPATLLNVDDDGRLFVKDGTELHVWEGDPGSWVKLDTTPVGAIIIWPGTSGVPDPKHYLECDGFSLDQDDFSEIYAIIGDSYTPSPSASSFNLPNLKGISVVGYGTQNDFGDDDRTKGSGLPISSQVEDQNQTFDGEVRAKLPYNESNLFRDFEGIYSDLPMDGDLNNKPLDRTGSDRKSAGFQVNLDNELISGEFYRHGAETWVSALAMAYYIKVK
jgi:hypothetical protein